MKNNPYPRAKPFNLVKQAVADDLMYVGDPIDYFFRGQFVEFTNTIHKAKGWDELLWRLQNAPPGLFGYRNFSLESWERAIAEHTLLMDPLKEKRELYVDLTADWQKLYLSGKQKNKRAELRRKLLELRIEIFNLEFPE